MYVESVVPKEDLLVWNLKDGWEPLCNFLGKKVPVEPIPHDNKTGDVEFVRNLCYKSDIYAVGMRNVVKNLLIIFAKVSFVLCLVYSFVQWRTNYVSIFSLSQINGTHRTSFWNKVTFNSNLKQKVKFRLHAIEQFDERFPKTIDVMPVDQKSPRDDISRRSIPHL